MALPSRSTKSVLFPSQRGDYIWTLYGSPSSRGKVENLTGLRSPPMGVSASRLKLPYPEPLTSGSGSGQVYSATHRLDGSSVSRSRGSRAATAVATKVLFSRDTKEPFETASGILDHIDTEAKLREIPSSWSNRRINIDYRHPFAKFLLLADNSKARNTDSQICLTCKNLNQSPMLSCKTEEERALFTRLCEEALRTRRDAMAFYSGKYDKELTESQAALKNFRPEDHKARLGRFMLKLVTERQEMLKKRHPGRVRNQDKVAGFLSDQDQQQSEEIGLGAKAPTRPVYCMLGWTTVGKPTDGMYFPNTFADLSLLRKPKDDPPGYRRYCSLVRMQDFKDSEIFMRVRGNILTFDGVHLRLRADETLELPGARIVSEYVELPKGVYPGRLRIGRSFDGILVIQEPWDF